MLASELLTHASRRRRGAAVLLVLLAMWTGRLAAKLPELDAVSWGNLTQQSGQPLVPLYTGQIVVVARWSGVILAQSTVSLGQSGYVLNVPLDDGVNPRLPNTARFGEQVRFYLRNTATNVEIETVESANAGGFTISSVKGALRLQNLSVTGNLTGTGGNNQNLSGYAAWKLTYLGPGGLDPYHDDSNLDSNGNGMTNLQKYIAGLNPLDATDRFRIQQIVHGNGVASVQFGPVHLKRRYTIFSADSMTSVAGWAAVGTFVPTADGGFSWFDHVKPSQPGLFYRVQVDLQ